MPRILLSLFLGLVLFGLTQTGSAFAARAYDRDGYASYDAQGYRPFFKSRYRAYDRQPKFSLFKPAPVTAPAPALTKGELKNGDVKVEISRDQQKMDVYVAGRLQHSWAVSTGRRGFKTPGGSYKPTWMTKMWHSKQWQNAPMPHSVFFKEGYAIHATNETGNLGRPASHGCVRLAPKNAARLFELIKTHGEKKTRIVVS